MCGPNSSLLWVRNMGEYNLICFVMFILIVSVLTRVFWIFVLSEILLM
jgi:hypothetical protein